MNQYYLLGDPITHSLSPKMHNLAFRSLGLDARYDLLPTKLEEFPDTIARLRREGASGWNITMPGKEVMATLCDHLSKAAEIGGSVNTVVNRSGVLYGDTTDGVGFVHAVRRLGCPISGKKLVLFGTGGAASAILIQCALDGAREISVFYNRPSSGERIKALCQKLKGVSRTAFHFYTYENEILKRELSSADLLCNATNVGMDTGKSAGKDCLIPDPAFLNPGLLVYDIIYHPAETPLLKMAKSRGCTASNGLSMLLLQGAASFKIWTGKDMPLQLVGREVFHME